MTAKKSWKYGEYGSFECLLFLFISGISAFVKDNTENVYRAHTYNLPLCPMAFGTLDPTFVLQVQ